VKYTVVRPAAQAKRLSPPLGPAYTVPADLPRTPAPVLAWEPSFLAWMQYARDSALVAWVRERILEPVPHVVYLVRCASGAFYVGITKNLDERMADHRRSARRDTREHDSAELRAYQMAPSAAYLMRHGFDRVEATIGVPDRVAALLAEVNWTCLLAGAGFTVFGHAPGALCPGHDWSPRVPYWDRNMVLAPDRR